MLLSFASNISAIMAMGGEQQQHRDAQVESMHYSCLLFLKVLKIDGIEFEKRAAKENSKAETVRNNVRFDFHSFVVRVYS